MIETVVFGGLVNWLATYIWVEGEVFREVREFADKHLPPKLRYLFHCPLCAGTWVGFLEAALIPGPFTGPIALFLNGLLYKAAGHLILEVAAILRHQNALLEAAEGRMVFDKQGYHSAAEREAEGVAGHGAGAGADYPVWPGSDLKGHIVVEG